MNLFFHELRTEQMLFWRNREAAIFTFFLPVVFFLIFGAVYGNDTITKEHVRGAAFLEAGMIGYGVAATCFAGLGITLVVRRESGILKRIRATPLPPAAYLLAVLASTFIVFLIEAAIIIGIGRVLFSVAIPDRLLSLLVVLILGALCFAAMGVGISGLVRSSEGSSGAINAVYLPMAIISGTFFTPKGYPEFLKVIAAILPLTHYTQLTRDVMLRGHHFWSDAGAIGVVVAWAAIGIGGAIRGFRWQPVDA
ncbi:MAG TPA: ABC transporter permease [Gaiellaceae bacterium]|jgi:ABC-2 type transport system permease protein